MGVFQCKKDKVVKSDTNDHLIPKELIDKIAQRFNPKMHANNAMPTTIGSDSINVITLLNRTIKNAIAIPDKNNVTAFYIYNYTSDSGWVMISADNRMEPILAFSDHGEILPATYPSGFLSWLDRTIEDIEILRDGLYTNNLATTAWWVLLDANNLDTYTAVKRAKPALLDPQPCTTMTVTGNGPLLPVSWGQGCGYNANITTVCSTRCNRAPTGCVATAMSQVIRFWQSPGNYNYAAMPRNTGNTNVATLMSDAGGAVSMNYTCTGSSASLSLVDNAFKSSTFNYSSADYHSTFSIANVESNVHSGKPAILGGCNTKNYYGLFNLFHKYEDCHAWVCDGCIHNNYCNTYVISYYHMNWGWREQFDVTDDNGWFSIRSWSIPGTNWNFKYANDEVVNIHP